MSKRRFNKPRTRRRYNQKLHKSGDQSPKIHRDSRQLYKNTKHDLELKLKKADPDYEMIARELVKLGKFERKKIDKPTGWAYARASQLYRYKISEPQKALNYAKISYEINRESSFCASTYGNELARHGRFKEALPLLESSYKKTKHFNILANLVRTCRALKLHNKLEYYNALLETAQKERSTSLPKTELEINAIKKRIVQRKESDSQKEEQKALLADEDSLFKQAWDAVNNRDISKALEHLAHLEELSDNEDDLIDLRSAIHDDIDLQNRSIGRQELHY